MAVCFIRRRSADPHVVYASHRQQLQPGPSRPGLFARAVSWIGPFPFRQAGLLLGVIAIFWFLGNNTLSTMERAGLTPGFAFLSQRANFEIGESVIAYAAGDSYGRAILAGIANTAKVAALGCLLATLLGVALGIARLSGNPLLSRLVQAYVEILRGTPLLLQLFLWSSLFQHFPAPRNASSLFESIFVSNRGVFVPSFGFDGLPATLWIPGFALVLLGGWAIARKMFFGTTQYGLKMTALLLALFVVSILALKLTGFTPTTEIPAKGGFNIRGGLSLSPEFAALLIGLVVNASATISEIVRSGIQSVRAGQWEAARALGMKPGQIMRLIVFPQALRVITPLMTSSYLDLTKNSSLAVAIGFPDIVSVANTTANTTGQVLEAIALIMAVYLGINLAVSAFMNVYNRKIALKGALVR